MSVPPHQSSTRDLDLSLLRGFSFHCLPGCGLCCYATPAVTPLEKERLIQIDATTPFLEGESGFFRISDRPEGGACHFLEDNRCTCYQARPFPCKEFPLSVHLGSRPQATLHLFCPGVDLAGIELWTDPKAPRHPPRGLEGELASVISEYQRAPIDAWLSETTMREVALRRRMERQGLWTEPEKVRAAIRKNLPFPAEEDFPAIPPPGSADGLETLPLFHDERYGRVVFRALPEGLEVIALRETGGVRDSIGVYSPLSELPSLDIGAEEILRGYLSYVLQRDQFLWAVYSVVMDQKDASIMEMTEEFLREAATQVLSRGWLRVRIDGGSGETLTRSDVERGIRATDMDIMDQPTLGRFL